MFVNSIGGLIYANAEENKIKPSDGFVYCNLQRTDRKNVLHRITRSPNPHAHPPLSAYIKLSYTIVHNIV